MLISHKQKWIFCHISKTAGTSIKSVLKPFSDISGCTLAQQAEGFDKYPASGPREDLDFNIHDPLSKMIGTLKNKKDIDASSYFKFAFVRNPWDSLVSCYFYRVKESKNPCVPMRDVYAEQTTIGFEKFVKRHVGHLVTQFSMINKNQTSTHCDFIGRFENLNEDFAEVCRLIGLPEIKLKAYNTTKHKHYTEYYTEETKKIVENHFKKDIEYFNYEF